MFKMDIMNDKFFKGLTAGIIMGMFFNTFKNYIFNSKFMNRNCKRVNESVESIQQNKSSIKANGEFKMALLVRHDLKMGKGKVAAQCSHAIVHCYEEGLKSSPREINSWELNNKPVNVFKIADEETMFKYKKLAVERGFNTYIVIDAGRTQVAPRSKTVMAIGPAESDQIDLFTQSLQEY